MNQMRSTCMEVLEANWVVQQRRKDTLFQNSLGIYDISSSWCAKKCTKMYWQYQRRSVRWTVEMCHPGEKYQWTLSCRWGWGGDGMTQLVENHQIQWFVRHIRWNGTVVVSVNDPEPEFYCQRYADNVPGFECQSLIYITNLTVQKRYCTCTV